MSKPKKGIYRRKKTLLKRPKGEIQPIDPKDIPQHLLDKMPSGFKLHPTMQDLRRSAMNSIAQPYIPLVSPQQQQLNQLRDNNDNKERMINDVARSLEQERERKKDLKMKENENKLKNQEDEHNLKMQEMELKNQIDDKKMKFKLEEKQRDLQYQESKLNNSNILASAEMNYNDKLAELNDMKIENERLQAETKYNVLIENSKKADREVKSLKNQNEAMRKTLESLKSEEFIKQFQECVNEQQQLQFENELLESMMKQQRQNQRLLFEKQLQPDENAVKAINAKYDKDLQKIKDETLKLDEEAENMRELYSQIERKKQLLKENETNKEKLINETARMKKLVEGVDPEKIDQQITDSIHKQVDKQKEFELQKRMKDLNDEIYQTQIDITTQKHRDDFENSLPGILLSKEIALKAVQAERLQQQKDLSKKEYEQTKLEQEITARKFVYDTLNAVEDPRQIDEVIKNNITTFHNAADSYSRYFESAFKDKQLAIQMQNQKVEELNNKIANFFCRLQQDETAIGMLNEYNAEHGIDGATIVEHGDIIVKNKLYTDFKQRYKLEDEL